jgi:transposase
MIRLVFTNEEIEALEDQRFVYPHPMVQRRMEALYLKSQGLAHQEICRLCRISKATLVRCLHTYAQEGIEGLKRLDYAGQTSALASHAESLEAYFHQHLPHTCVEAQRMIEEQTGVRRSLTQVRLFLHKLKMDYRKTGFVPGRADTPEKQAEQEEFLKKS